jgi:hypothetical protein
MPAMMPENKGAPEASAIPKHNGKATKNTTILAGRSLFNSLNKSFIIAPQYVLKKSMLLYFN